MPLCDPGYRVPNISNIGNKLPEQVQVCTNTPDSSQVMWEVSMVLSPLYEVVCVHLHSCDPGCPADGAQRWTLRRQCTLVDVGLASSCCRWALQLGQFPVSGTECENSTPKSSQSQLFGWARS